MGEGLVGKSWGGKCMGVGFCGNFGSGQLDSRPLRALRRARFCFAQRHEGDARLPRTADTEFTAFAAGWALVVQSRKTVAKSDSTVASSDSTDADSDYMDFNSD